MGVKPLLLLLATRLSKYKLSEIYCILDKPHAEEIESSDEASYSSCIMSGIAMDDDKMLTKWPLNFIRPIEIYFKLN